MNINNKVVYLKQFLSEGQLSLLDKIYPTGEYTTRTIQQIEKTLSEQYVLKVEDVIKPKEGIIGLWE